MTEQTTVLKQFSLNCDEQEMRFLCKKEHLDVIWPVIYM